MLARRSAALAAALLALVALPAAAQQGSASPSLVTPATAPIAADLLMDIEQLESKMMGLARAIPADRYAWRPGQGVRSVSEVLLHVAADNWFLPAAVGHAADSATGIKVDNFSTVQAFERRQLDRDATIAELARSFAHLKRSLASTPASRLGEKVSIFGRTFTTQQTWILTATHLHEHLGQLIAYARSNGIAPPWAG